MTERVRVACEMPTRLRCIDDVREWALAHGRDAGLDEEALFAIQIAVSEALSNVVRHSFRGEGHHHVPVALDIDDAEVRVVIRDRGEPFDATRYRRPDLDEPGTGGYGIHLIHEVMDDVIRENTHDGTLITLIKRRATGGATP